MEYLRLDQAIAHLKLSLEYLHVAYYGWADILSVNDQEVPVLESLADFSVLKSLDIESSAIVGPKDGHDPKPDDATGSYDLKRLSKHLPSFLRHLQLRKCAMPDNIIAQICDLMEWKDENKASLEFIGID